VNFDFVLAPFCLNVNCLAEFIPAPSSAAVVDALLDATITTAHTPSVTSYAVVDAGVHQLILT